MHFAWNVVRLATVGLLLAAIPVAASLPALAALALLVLVLAVLITVETIRHADLRRELRGA